MSELGTALELRGVSKRFPGTLAVDDVSLVVRAGEVHALVGENGAGKSTLMKIIAGSFDDYTGQVLLNDRPVRLESPAAASAAGIAMIHQELSLAGPISVAENLLAGRLPRRRGLLDRRALLRQARRCLGRVGLGRLDPTLPAEALSPHEAQLVEIAKALGRNPCILVMDEPTSSLSRAEVERLFEIIRRLRRRGLAIVYISHHLAEVLAVADRVTVLRDGRKVATKPVAETSAAELVELMVGRNVGDLYARRARRPGPVVLRVEHLTRRGFFHDVSFQVRAGEILALGGLAGSGRSEVARCLCGIDPFDGGRIILDGRAIRPRSYRRALREGLAYLTEDRKSEGLALRLRMDENLLAALIPRHCRWGFYSRRRGRGALGRLIESLEITPPRPGQVVRTLSGGNQQKVLLAKWLATDPKVLILDEPTRGVDVGAKVTIHRAIAALADAGRSVILISSDLPELVGLADRVAILRDGRLLGEMDAAEATEASVLLAANGEWEFARR